MTIPMGKYFLGTTVVDVLVVYIGCVPALNPIDP